MSVAADINLIITAIQSNGKSELYFERFLKTKHFLKSTQLVHTFWKK